MKRKVRRMILVKEVMIILKANLTVLASQVTPRSPKVANLTDLVNLKAPHTLKLKSLMESQRAIRIRKAKVLTNLAIQKAPQTLEVKPLRIPVNHHPLLLQKLKVITNLVQKVPQNPRAKVPMILTSRKALQTLKAKVLPLLVENRSHLKTEILTKVLAKNLARVKQKALLNLKLKLAVPLANQKLKPHRKLKVNRKTLLTPKPLKIKSQITKTETNKLVLKRTRIQKHKNRKK
ncbi:hypothetical protein O3G_MSEX013795 [Manduca sexta]|uniref:Uncharacterized protein n=1 Tax=Manduca sexta TaxID=7130 RepID=A0A922CXI6_MANSE|nr:hypothetical protein O3G_MSEX013795 [Manduca sexta]